MAKSLASKTGEVTYLKKGDKGDIGALIYPAGEYLSTISYSRTTLSAPMVLHEEKYYVLNKEGTFIGINPKTDYAANGNKATWVLMDKVKYAFIEMLMANFAKLASAVFYGQYMFSQQGTNADGAATSDYCKFGTDAFTPNLMLDFQTGEASFSNGNITFGADGEIVCNKGIFKIGVQKIFREISLNDYTTESFKANLGQGLNYVFTKDVGNDTHRMTLPASLDLDGFESEMYFYGNPGWVIISGENGVYPFMYNGMRVKQIKIGSFPRRLSLTARKSNLSGANYVEWWITNTNDYTLSGKVSDRSYDLATSVYYNT